jgi:hypothetical protein
MICIKMKFFYFSKNIFDINILKKSKNIKKNLKFLKIRFAYRHKHFFNLKGFIIQQNNYFFLYFFKMSFGFFF